MRSYIRAREQNNASLACSMLTREQQREVVAAQGGHYTGAQAAACPEFILGTDPSSHLLNPSLPEMLNGRLLAAYSPLGAVVVRSPSANLTLIAVRENGQLKLDVRGLEKLSFERECAAGGTTSKATCGCIFSLLRAQGLVREQGMTSAILRAMSLDALRCRTEAAAGRRAEPT